VGLEIEVGLSAALEDEVLAVLVEMDCLAFLLEAIVVWLGVWC
jgi:hypothetical protein